MKTKKKNNKPIYFPMQPLEKEFDGTYRFKKNSIVALMREKLKMKGYGLNEIVQDCENGSFSIEELIQFYQLIGISVCGLEELDFVPDEYIEQVHQKVQEDIENQAREVHKKILQKKGKKNE